MGRQGQEELSQATSSRIRDKGLRLSQGRLRLDCKKIFFIERVLNIGMGFSGRVVKPTSLEVLKRLNVTLSAVV